MANTKNPNLDDIRQRMESVERDLAAANAELPSMQRRFALHALTGARGASPDLAAFRARITALEDELAGLRQLEAIEEHRSLVAECAEFKAQAEKHAADARRHAAKEQENFSPRGYAERQGFAGEAQQRATAQARYEAECAFRNAQDAVSRLETRIQDLELQWPGLLTEKTEAVAA